MTTHISDDVRDLVSTWPDGDYMIEPSSEGRYGAFKDDVLEFFPCPPIRSTYQHGTPTAYRLEI